MPRSWLATNNGHARPSEKLWKLAVGFGERRWEKEPSKRQQGGLAEGRVHGKGEEVRLSSPQIVPKALLCSLQ